MQFRITGSFKEIMLITTSYLNVVFCMPYFLQTDGKCFVSADACFGLPRKKASGVSYRQPLSAKMYFYEQQDVDQFMSLYPKSTKESQQSKVTYCIKSVKYCPNMLMPCCMGQLLLQLAMQFLVQWIGKIESHAFCEESTISMLDLYLYSTLFNALYIQLFL